MRRFVCLPVWWVRWISERWRDLLGFVVRLPLRAQGKGRVRRPGVGGSGKELKREGHVIEAGEVNVNRNGDVRAACTRA